MEKVGVISKVEAPTPSLVRGDVGGPQNVRGSKNLCKPPTLEQEHFERTSPNTQC